MEKRIFEVIEFDINMPVAYSFTRRFADIVAFDIKEVFHELITQLLATQCSVDIGTLRIRANTAGL